MEECDEPGNSDGLHWRRCERETHAKQPAGHEPVATTERWRDKSGEKKERVEWHKLVMFGDRAEKLAPHITKGQLLTVTGQIQTTKWQDKEGKDRWMTQIKIDTVEFLGKGSGGRDRQDDGPSHGSDGGSGSESYDQPIDDSDSIPFATSHVASKETVIGEAWSRANQRLI